MALTPVPPIDPALPPAPDPTGDEATFDSEGYVFTVGLSGFGSDLEAIGAATYANAVYAHEQATDAQLQATDAAASAVIAQSAAGAAGAVAWVSGTTYTAGDVRYSPINFQNYRRKTSGAGTTDPSLDTANWAILGVDPATVYPFSNSTLMAQNHAIALYF